MCPWKDEFLFFIAECQADFVFPQISHLVNEVLVATMGWNSRLKKFFSRSYYALFTTSLFQSKYKGSDGIERNTTFNNEYVINALFGKEWKINNKWMLTTDMKFTAAGGRYVTPIDLAASQLAARKCCSKTRPLPKNSVLTSGWISKWGRTNRKAGASILPWTSKILPITKTSFEAIQCHCRSHRYSIPNWIFSWHFMEGSVLIQVSVCGHGGKMFRFIFYFVNTRCV